MPLRLSRPSRFVLAVLPFGALAAACAPQEPPAPVPPPVVTTLPATTMPPAPPPREDGRLPKTVTPLRVGLTLNIDPTKERFAGSERIIVRAEQPTSHVVLNAMGLHVTETSLVVKGDRFQGIRTGRVAHGGFAPEELVLSFDPPIPAGEAEIDLSWDAAYSPNLMGLSRERDGERWYAFSDFEPTHARNVFPAFDEPSYKVPYDVTLIVPRGMSAFANGPESGRNEDASHTTFTFAPTPPLPSYLVAFAVGDLDVKTADVAAAPSLLVRVLAAKGKGALSALSVKDGTELVKTLADYFGIAYPYAKLDLVAVPDFAPGAMENPGLVTFREALLLVDPAHSGTQVRHRQAQVIAHELAHQWFGDLVTLAWWNDTWLNEGFARWAQTKAVERVHPESRAVFERLPATDTVMDEDTLASARAVRQPVTTAAEAIESFDRITYDKGAAVVAMIEAWVGEDVFRRAVHEYLTAHAWGNATAGDLFASLEKASGKPVGAVASSFVDQAGVPEVDVALSCNGAAHSWRVDLSESTWRLIGAREDGKTRPGWQFPACVRVAGQKDDACVQLTAEAPTQSITGSGACPSYVRPNPARKGYFRSALTEPATRALARAARGFDVPGRLGVLTDTWAAVRSGKLAPAVIFDVLPLFDHDEDRFIVEEIVSILRSMSDSLVEDDARPAFRAYVRARLNGHARLLGWTSKKETSASAKLAQDPDDAALSRLAVVSALGDLGDDRAILDQAETYAKAWLADPTSVDADVAQLAVKLASHAAKEDRLTALAGAAEHASAPEVRVLAEIASAQFDDPVVETRALDRLLTDAVKKQDVTPILMPAMQYIGSRRTAVAWIEAHWDALRAKLVGSLARRAVTAASFACTSADRDHAEAFFTERARSVEGAGRLLSEALETATLCSALHTKDAPEVSRLLHATRR